MVRTPSSSSTTAAQARRRARFWRLALGWRAGYGGVEGGEVAFADDLDQDAAFVPGGGVGADLVLGDHGGEGVGDVAGGAEEGGDGGVGLGAATGRGFGGR